MEKEIDQQINDVEVLDAAHDVWLRAGILKFDEIKMKEKLCFNPHMIELVGFVGGAINNDAVSHNFKN